eukprot:6202611-Pleurochrysis_carterae.AAC.1
MLAPAEPESRAMALCMKGCLLVTLPTGVVRPVLRARAAISSGARASSGVRGAKRPARFPTPEIGVSEGEIA